MSNDHPDEPGHAPTAVRSSASTLAPEAPAGPGQVAGATVGRFVVDRLLGRGGMASVYLAQERGTQRQVALKVMAPHLQSDPSFVQRFLHEAKATASLRHPNIVELFDAGQVDGHYYLATEYVDGGTVAALLRDMKELPPALAGELMTQLFAGLHHAHQSGLVHRDLKPENLLLTSGGILKVADFGIARLTEGGEKLTKTGMLVGTAGYMSPEQARGFVVDGRSDLFTAGIILYELLTGQNPFSSDSPATSITRILANAALPIFQVKPSAPLALEWVLERLLQADPGARFASAQEAQEALLAFVAERRQRQPTLVAECMRRPQELKQRLDQEAAVGLLAEARALLGGGQLELTRAAVKVHLAQHYDPGNPEAPQVLAQLSSRMRVNFGAPENTRIAELERYVEKYPDTPQVLQQLAQAYKMDGNPLKAAIYTKRYLRLRPQDEFAKNQLFQLTGERWGKGPGAAPRLGPATRDLVAGIKTGGFQARPQQSPDATGLLAPQTGAQSAPTEAVPMPMPVSSGVDVVYVQPRSALAGLVLRLGLLGLLAGGAWGAWRWLDGYTERQQTEQRKLGDKVRREADAVERQQLEAAARADELARAQKAEAESVEWLDEGVRQLDEKRWASADQTLSRLLDRYPKRTAGQRALFYRGKARQGAGDAKGAAADYTAFLARDAASDHAAEARLRRAEVYAQDLKAPLAYADLAELFLGHPDSRVVPEARVLRAELYLAEGRGAEARADLELVLASPAELAVKERARALLAKAGAPDGPR